MTLRKLKAVALAVVLATTGLVANAAPAQAVTGVLGVWNANNNYRLGLIYTWPVSYNYDRALDPWGISTGLGWGTVGGIYLADGYCARRYTGPDGGPWTRAGSDFVGPGKFRLQGNYWVQIQEYRC